MHTVFKSKLVVIGAAAVGAAVLAGHSRAQQHGTTAAQRRVEVKDFDVFVEPQSRMAFVKKPNEGWVFLRQYTPSEMQNLPAHTLISLLPHSEAATRWADAQGDARGVTPGVAARQATAPPKAVEAAPIQALRPEPSGPIAATPH